MGRCVGLGNIGVWAATLISMYGREKYGWLGWRARVKEGVGAALHPTARCLKVAWGREMLSHYLGRRRSRGSRLREVKARGKKQQDYRDASLLLCPGAWEARKEARER